MLISVSLELHGNYVEIQFGTACHTAALLGVLLAAASRVNNSLLPIETSNPNTHVGVLRYLVVMVPIGPGEKSLVNLSEHPEQHATGRKPLSEALSPKAVLELQPNVNAILEKLILRLEGFAESGQVGVGCC